MEIRIADLADKTEIITLYERSQNATGIPDPTLIPPGELGQKLYERHAFHRYIAIEAGRIVGHALTEEPNPAHAEKWRYALQESDDPLVEMGGAFVDPTLSGKGIWTGLLKHSIDVIGKSGAHPVTATWSTNEHVKRTLLSQGGINAGRQFTPLGSVDLFVFLLHNVH